MLRIESATKVLCFHFCSPLLNVNALAHNAMGTY